MKVDGDMLVMDDGTPYYANGGIVGLDPWLDITEGYDGGISNFDANPDTGDLPEAHRKEIAAYMIQLWQRVLTGEPRHER